MNETELFLQGNQGVLERAPQASDFLGEAIAGARSKIPYVSRLTQPNWTLMLSPYETQRYAFDSMACVSFSAIQCVQAQMNWDLENGKIPRETEKWLRENGYMVKGTYGMEKFQFSDRFTAKASGTTQAGNYATSVWDSVRNDGLVPEASWPWPQGATWEEYYCALPKELAALAKEFQKRVEIMYEFVIVEGYEADRSYVESIMLQSPLQLIAPICGGWSAQYSGDKSKIGYEGELVKACNKVRAEHATPIVSVSHGFVGIADTYQPRLKRLENGYPMPFILRGVVFYK